MVNYIKIQNPEEFENAVFYLESQGYTWRTSGEHLVEGSVLIFDEQHKVFDLIPLDTLPKGSTEASLPDGYIMLTSQEDTQRAFIDLEQSGYTWDNGSPLSKGSRLLSDKVCGLLLNYKKKSVKWMLKKPDTPVSWMETTKLLSKLTQWEELSDERELFIARRLEKGGILESVDNNFVLSKKGYQCLKDLEMV